MSKSRYKEKPTAGYAATDAWANATGFSIIVPKDAEYIIDSSVNFKLQDAGATEAKIYFRLYNNTKGVVIGEALRNEYSSLGSDDLLYFNSYLTTTLRLNKGEEITLQAKMDTGDNSTIVYSSGNYENYIQYREL